jgi:hypothetical protein
MEDRQRVATRSSRQKTKKLQGFAAFQMSLGVSTGEFGSNVVVGQAAASREGRSGVVTVRVEIS